MIRLLDLAPRNHDAWAGLITHTAGYTLFLRGISRHRPWWVVATGFAGALVGVGMILVAVGAVG